MSIINVKQNAPAELRAVRQWVCWRKEKRKDGQVGKCPVNPNTGRNASAKKSSTWTDFETACAASEAKPNVCGVGFMFTKNDPFCGVDLDDCRAPETGAISPWAQELIDKLDSYTEVSPSETGVKIFVQAAKQGLGCRAAYHDGEVEIYDKLRYFTVTGMHLSGTPKSVNARQAELDAVVELVLGEENVSTGGGAQVSAPAPTPTKASLTDEEIVAKAGSRRGEFGEKFKQLMAGNFEDYTSQSEADLALATILAWYTKDPKQIDRIFRTSGLMREKWEKNESFRKRTLLRAVKDAKGQYSSEQNSDDLPPLFQPDEVAKLFKKETNPVIYWRGSFYQYTGKFYRKLNDSEVTAKIVIFIKQQKWWTRPAKKLRGEYEEGAQPHPDYQNLIVVVFRPVTRTTDVREILLHLKSNHLSDEFDAPIWLDGRSAKDTVVMDNALLHLAPGKEPELRPHSLDLFTLGALPYPYEPDADCDMWLKFLDVVLPNDELQSIIQEFFGWCLIPDQSYQRILVLQGNGGNGKSVVLGVLRRLVGERNCSAESLGNLKDPHTTAGFVGKLVNIADEFAYLDSVAQEVLRQVSGGGHITVNPKNKPTYETKLPTRFAAATNEPPRISDKSDGIWRRLIIVPFNYQIPETGRVPFEEYLDQHCAFLPGIFNWALKGLVRLRDRGRFVESRHTKKAKTELRKSCNQPHSWCEDNLKVESSSSAKHEDVYREFDRWRENSKYLPITESTFGRELSRWYKEMTGEDLTSAQERMPGGARRRVYMGIRLLKCSKPPETPVANVESLV